ncbi:hypothetical protein HNR05_000940 [Leifsonia psychrotolerans]|uniref:Uncharacterized protein n=1 Tax=Glaciibacter psychrotolerans TaxID=670054 RepID=A0A7Z0ECL9_9MICO|nr:hypothetical protein [Leifsonia psychrotolerans]
MTPDTIHAYLSIPGAVILTVVYLRVRAVQMRAERVAR